MDKMTMLNVAKQASVTGDYAYVGTGGVPDWMNHDLRSAGSSKDVIGTVVYVNEPKSEILTLSGSEMKAMQEDYENALAELHTVSLENTQLKSKIAYRDKRIEDDAVRLKASRKLRKSITKDIAYLRAQLNERNALLEVFHKTNLVERAQRSANEADKTHNEACKELEKLKR